MRDFERPILVVSKCLGFAHCRYDGLMINDDFVNGLRDYVELRPVCAENEIGLGIPRDPIWVVDINDELRLIQPSTGRELTEIMRNFVNKYLNSLSDVDGFILKSKSPSCGIRDTKIYSNKGDNVVLRRGSGSFGGAVLERFPHLAIEDEKRLLNPKIRGHFLTRIYALAGFRRAKSENTMKALIRFHSQNRLIIMAYNQMRMRELDRIVANIEKGTLTQAISDYEAHLYQAFANIPRYRSNINVLMQQTCFEPYPKGLLNIIEPERDRGI